MRRTSTYLAIAGLVAAMLVGAAALWLMPIELASSASPSASATAEQGDGAAGAPEIPWVFFSQLPPDGGPGAFVVQAGVLGEDRPRIDVEVPWLVDNEVELARMPAVARPAAGAVVYVADDGKTSTVQRLAIEPGARPEPLAAVEDAVWSIAAAPDGSVAFIAAVTRGRPDADLGVFRVALDGSGRVEPFLRPVAMKPEGGVRLAAIAPFTVTLDISADGRYLSRTACRGPDGCTTSIIDIVNGDARELGDMMFIDLGTGGMIVGNQCNGAGCTTKAVDLASGAMLDLPPSAGDVMVASENERPVVVTIEAPGVQSSLVLTDPLNGERRELFQPPMGNWLSLATHMYGIPSTDGAVLVVEYREQGGRVLERLLLVPLDGDAPIELPVPPIRQIMPPGVQG